jgi:hypothetical protein
MSADVGEQAHVGMLAAAVTGVFPSLPRWPFTL